MLLYMPLTNKVSSSSSSSSAALSHTGGFRVGCGVHDSYTFQCGVTVVGSFYFPWHRHQIERTNGFSRPKDTGKEGLTELPKFRTQSRLQWESNPAGNVRSPFKASALTHSPPRDIPIQACINHAKHSIHPSCPPPYPPYSIKYCA